jgi:hypothetical protein
MKKINYILVLAIILLSSCDFNKANRQSISVRKTESKFQFNASFPERKTGKVFDYIEKTLHSDRIFSSTHDDRDVEINLGDTIKFHLKSERGAIEILVRKQDNSFKHFKQIEQMCNGIKSVL